MRQTLIVMVKEPRPGRVKTRLARDIGSTTAAWWFRQQCAALLRRLRDPRWQIVLAVAPDRTGMNSRCWPSDLARIPQGRGDIGQRMERALRRIPFGRVCLIGADIPGMTRSHIARAFAALGHNDVVFGPAADGGFWLVGLCQGRTVPKPMFRQVRWSGPHTMNDAVAGLSGSRIALVDTLRDVDTGKDLRTSTRA